MDKNKKKVIFFVFSLLIILSVITFIVSIFINNNNPNNDGNVDSSNNEVFNKEFIRLNDVKVHFNIQNVINDFYLLLTNQQTKVLLQILDKDFIEERKINASNIYSYLYPGYSSVSYIAKNIYFNSNHLLTYYFVNGYLIDTTLDNSYKFYENVNYLIIVNEKNDNYVINLISSDIDILEYANKYDIQNKNINNNFILTKNDISDENKISTYLSEFINLIIYNPKMAYSLLNKDMKEKYSNFEDFNEDIYNIYTKLSAKIFSYTKKNKANVVYYIKDDKQNNIVIEEFNIMDYKISF